MELIGLNMLNGDGWGEYLSKHFIKTLTRTLWKVWACRFRNVIIFKVGNTDTFILTVSLKIEIITYIVYSADY